MNTTTESNPASENARNAVTESDTRPKKTTSAFGEMCGVLLLTCGLSIFVRLPYFPMFFASDDMDFLVQIGLYEAGRINFVEYCIFPQGAHTMMLWKAIFLGEWKLFGLDPNAWHLVLAIVQGFSATALYFCARAWSINRIGAVTMALIWAGAAIGGWDNPTLWLMCGMAPLAWFFFILVLREIAIVGKKGATPRASRWAALRMSALYFLSILVWSDMLLMAPIAGLALLWRGITQQPWNVIASWVAAWAAPLILLGPINVMLILPTIGSGGRLEERTPWTVASRTAGQFGVSLASLTYGTVAYPEIIESDAFAKSDALPAVEPLWPKLIWAMCLLALAAFTIRGEAVRYVVIFSMAVFVYLLIVNIGGIQLTFRDAINHGHYLYFPTLFWAVLVGAMFMSLENRLRGGRLVTLAAIVVLGFFIAHQRSVAASTAEIQRVMFKSPTERFHTTSTILRMLSYQAERDGMVVELPDTPLPLNSSSCPYWPLQAFVELTFPEGLSGVRIIPPHEVSSQQVALAADRLLALNESQARLWAVRMQQIYPLLSSLSWLIEASAEHPERIVCPNIRLDLWGANVPLKQLLLHGLSHGKRLSDNVKGDSPPPSREDYPALWQLLSTSDSDKARFLLNLFGWEN